MLIRLPKLSSSYTPSIFSGKVPPSSVESSELAQPVTAGSQLPDPDELPAGALRLVDRFVAGQAWLWVVRETLDAEPDAGDGSPLERRYVGFLDTLVSIENLLRFTYPQFEGCARGDVGPCDPLAVLRCLSCADGSPPT